MHGNEIERTVLSIDVGHKFGDLTLELGRVGQGGGRHLDQDNVANPLRVVLQQLLKLGRQLKLGLLNLELF